uniref:tenascin-X isoform X1 n=1 Tax=Ictidomys tridecemlineatus TaxID=43179 RepID=UPI001A9EE012|nr:tenascin-X isoform X1 [Ictidomys tridecemlineatus]
MPAQCPLTSSLTFLVLLGTASAGPFPPRSNVTLPAPRPPPQPGGGSPSSQLYEHTMEGGEKQVVFTHRINLPPSAGCGCPPGTEPPVPASEMQALRIRLEILEELVKGLKEQCTGGCCPAAAQAGTGQTDVRSLCSLHGVFDLSRCACSCEPGWGGPTCSDPTESGMSPSSPPAESGSCPDDCNDQGRCIRGRCVCFPGYTGPSCGWPSCPGDCQGRGRCVQGVCVCRAGFSGPDCGQRSCPRSCSQRGRCEDGRCVCDPGYTGEDCGVKSCPRSCSQRGRCENGRCVCNPGYSGEDCGVKSCPRGCSQRGRCEAGRCVCDPGYTGEDCGVRSCPWDCGEGGRCVDGRCVCWPGYAGEDCSTRTCPRNCRGRGRCEDGECICDAGYSGDDCGVRSCPGDCNQRGRCEDGRCVCWPGYTGPDCSARACPRDCRGRGRCENGVCVCNTGYSGEDCGVRSCPGDCRGRGRCESGRCVCWPGYTGRDCGTRACPGDCRGRGRCVDGRCVCNPGFTGEDCGSRRCPGDCRGHGRCEDGVCVCHAGYSGEDCSTRSCPGGCRGRGQCLDGRCVCDDGYSGEDCGVRRCPRDCSQHGVCQDGVCTCWEGYAGEDCSIRTCSSNCHGRGRCEDGRCVCDPGYTGPVCATRTCPADCRGRGRCVQGVCICHTGYGGEDCGQEEPPASACPGGCGPRELCRAGQCVCVEGFRGPDCAIQICPRDCHGRGECRQGSCFCQDGYAGEDCGEEVPAIENMRMHLLEETTVRTEWTRVPGSVDAYEIQFIPTTEGASPPFTARVPSSASAYDQRGLAPGQEYQVTVRALRGTSWGPPASKTITTMIDGPQDLRVVAVTPTTLELSWLRPQAEVDRFVVSYVSAGNQRVRLEVPPEADGTLLTDLMPGVEYVVTVTAERGRAVSYPASVRANTAPGHYSYPEVHPPAPPPKPRPRPAPASRPLRPAPPSGPAEEGEEESRPGPNLPQPSRRAWGNLTTELGRFRGTVQDLERHLRAHGYPLRANQTYTSVARHIHEYLQRRRAAAAPAGSPAPQPRRPHPTASPAAGTWKRDSNQGIYGLSPEGVDRLAAPRHPKPEVLGSSADGALLVSLDGLRGQFERVVLRWRPQLPAEGPSGELTVPGTTRTVSLPDLRPGTTYHVEVHGVRAGQTSKSYAFITTTGSSPSGLLGATDEPPPSGPSTTQGAEAPLLQQRPQELGELRVLGRDKTGRLRVTWTAQPDTFAHFQLRLQVPEGPGAHEELLPGDVRQALMPPPPPGAPYKLLLHGIPPGGKPSVPITYQGVMDRDGEKPRKSLSPPRLGELTVTDVTSDSLLLRWTVPEGEFDSFVIQYKDRDGPQVMPVEGPQRLAPITSLEPGRKYKFVLYGLVNKKRHGPLVAEAKILPQSDPSPETPPRLGKLWVTDPTPDSLHLSWTVPEGQFDSFIVQYKDKDGRPQVVPVEGPERSVIISPLDSDHKYRFTLFGIADKKRYGPLMADGTTAPERQEEPPRPESLEQPLLGELTVTGVTPDSLRLSWTVAQGPFDSFVVQYKDVQGQPQAVPVRGDENEVTVPGLESNRKYKMNLYGLHGRHRVGPVSVVAKTAPQEVVDEIPSPTKPNMEVLETPEQPRLGELTVTDSTPDSLSLSWTVPEGQFDHFLVQYKNGDGQFKVVRVPGYEDEVTISGLEPDHKYKMHLYGFHSGQRVGPMSATGVTTAVEETPSSIEVETPSPTEPSTEAPEPTEEPLLGELMVTGTSPDSLSLSWTVPQGQFDSFTIQYKDRDGQPQVVRVGGEERETTVGDLEPGRKYKMHLYGLHQGHRVGPMSTLGMTDPFPTTQATETPDRPLEPWLGELTVTDVTPDSVGLLWTVPEGEFDSFMIQYKDRHGQPQVVPVTADQREVTIPGLEPSRKYKFLLFGIQDGKRRSPVSVEAKTAARSDASPGALPRLGELWVTDTTPESLRLSWTVPEGHFDSFVVQYKSKDGPQVVPVEGHERSATITSLDPGRKYRFLLYGLLGKKRFGPLTADATTVSPSSVDHTGIKPQLGEELQVTGVTSDSVGLSWTVPEGQFDSFVVQYKDRDGQPQVVPVDGSLREVNVSGLDPDRRYKLLLYGLHNSKRVGPLSAIAMTAPREKIEGDIPTPSPPTAEPHLGELMVEEATPHSLHLSWMVINGEFDSFEVQYEDRDGQLQVVSTGGDQSDITLTGLESNHRYLVTLYGFHDGQRVDSTHIEALTVPQEEENEPSEVPTMTPEPPLRPHLGELTVTDATPDSLSLSWTIPEGQFDHFLVQYKNGDGQPKVMRVPGHEDEVTISGLEPDHKYKMHLYGFHSGQRTGPISVIGVTTAEEETPSPTEVEETPRPTEPSTDAPESTEEPLLGELTVTGASPDSLSLSWTVPQGHFDSFTIQYKDRDGQPQVVRVGGEEREATVGDLEPGRKYKMHLYGLHQGHRVGPASAVGVTSSLPTQTPVEPHLGDLAVAAVTLDTVHLSWTVAQGPFDSFLVQYKDAQGQLQAVPVNRDLREVTVSGLDPARKYRFLLFGLLDGKRHGPVSVDAKTLPDKKPSPRLGELTVTDVTPDSMGLSWTVPEGEFDSFVIQYKDRDGQPQVVPVAADQRKVTIPSLEPNRKYKFLLYGLAGRKRLGPLSADGTTAALEKTQQPPPRLGELAVTEETSDSLRLSWTVAQGPFDSFLVQYKDTNGQSQAVPVAADQLEVTIEGLKPGRKYKFLLYGLVGGKRVGPVSILGMTAPEEDTPAPEAPEPSEAPNLGVLAVTEATPDSLRLSWSVVQGPFDSFVVQYLDTDGQPQALLVDGDQNKVLISGLEPNTSYQFSLYGLHEGMRRGPISTEGTTGPPPAGLTPGDPGPRLSHLSVTDVTTSSLRLNWEAPLGAFDSFLLRFGVPSPSTLEPRPRPLLQRELMVPGTRRSAVLRDLRPGTLYSLTLYGLRGPHKADSIQGTARTLSPILESPRDLQFSEIGETSAMVSWVPPPSRVDSFKVSYQLADGGEPQSVQVDGRAQTQKIQGLIPGARYEVTVVSVRGFEESEPLTGFLTTVPDGPTELRALNLTEGSTLLHWKPPQNPVDKYNVQVTAPGAPSLQDSAPGSAVDYPLRDLVLHTNYTATVRGLRGPNFTSPASITFTTGLKAPLDLETKEVTPRTALLTWTEPQVLPTGYLLSFDTPGGQTQEILLPSGITSHRLLGLFPSTYYNARLQAVWGQSLTPPVSTSFTTGGLQIPFPRDCGEEMQNGPSTSRTTTIFLNGNRERPLNVFCDMETDGGGWLVFQRRMDGQTDFWRDWEDYAHGFGNISREFWLGNEALHSLTQAGDYSMRVDLRAGDEAVFAQYDSFRVGSAAENYRLHLEGYHGTAGDSMSYHSGSVFSARDRDPNNLLISCAVSYRGAWWYRNCHYANLNGLYGSTVDHQGVSWYHWKGFEFSVPFTEMKLRPRSYRSPVGGG